MNVLTLTSRQQTSLTQEVVVSIPATTHDQSDVRRLGIKRTSIVILIALLLRLGPTLAHGALGGILEYDDGVHLGAAIHLLSGVLPYRDFTFVQPPGIAVLMIPFAAVARLLGEPSAMAMARVMMAALGALNALLCARCAAPWGRRAAFAAGIFYSVWPAAVLSERTIMLEPILTAALLGALLLLRRNGHWSAPSAGVLLGLAVSVKLVILPLVAVVGLWLLVRRGWSPLLAMAGSLFATVLVIIGPFFALAPGSAWRMIVLDQLGRPRSGGSMLDRFSMFDGNLFNQTTQHGLGPFVAVVFIAAMVSAAIRASSQALGAGLYLILFLTALVEVLVAPDFYYHYAALVAGPAAVLLGVVWANTGAIRSRAIANVALGCGILIVVSFGLISTAGHAASIDTDALEVFFSAHPCAMADSSLLIAGDDDLRSDRIKCGTPVDVFGETLDVTRGQPKAAAESTTQNQRAQVIVQNTILASDGAVILGSADQQGWSTETIRVFQQKLKKVYQQGLVEAWVPRTTTKP